MAPRYGAGSCCGFGWRYGGIKLRFRHTDLCDSAGLSGFNLIDRWLQDCNRESERQRCQLHCWHATTGKLDTSFQVFTGQRVSAISNDAGTFSLSITELTD